MKGILLAGLGIGLPMALLIIGNAVWHAGQTHGVTSPQPPPPTPSPAPSTRMPQVPDATVAVRQPRQASLIDPLLDWLDEWQQRALQQTEVKLKVAGDLLRQRRYDQAARSFDRLLVRYPNNTVVMLGKALALCGLGRQRDALPLFEHALEREPGDLAARFNYATALARAGERDSAIRELQTVLRQQPQHARAAFNLAILLQSAGRRQEAIAEWRRLTDQPSEPTLQSEAWFHRGELALDLHLADEAEQCFLRVLETSPDDVAAWSNVGIARAAVGRRDQALAALAQALQRDPGFLPAINQSIFIHAAQYRDTNSIASREQALQLCRQSLAIAADQPSIRQLHETLLALNQP